MIIARFGTSNHVISNISNFSIVGVVQIASGSGGDVGDFRPILFMK